MNNFKWIHTTECTGIGTPISVAISGATSAWLIFTGKEFECFFAYDSPAPQVTIGTSVSLAEPSPWEPIKTITVLRLNSS